MNLLAEMNSPSGFTPIVILHEDIHATWLITLFMEELDTMSKTDFMEGLLFE